MTVCFGLISGAFTLGYGYSASYWVQYFHKLRSIYNYVCILCYIQLKTMSDLKDAWQATEDAFDDMDSTSDEEELIIKAVDSLTDSIEEGKLWPISVSALKKKQNDVQFSICTDSKMIGNTSANCNTKSIVL